MYLWFRSAVVHDAYKSAVLPFGLVTFIAAFHYLRVFDSREEDYSCSAGGIRDGVLDVPAPALTGVPFDDDRSIAAHQDLAGLILDDATLNIKTSCWVFAQPC